MYNVHHDYRSLLFENSIGNQAFGGKCQATARPVKLSTSFVKYESDAVLVHEAPVDATIQITIQMKLRTRISYHSYNLTLAGNPKK